MTVLMQLEFNLSIKKKKKRKEFNFSILEFSLVQGNKKSHCFSNVQIDLVTHPWTTS